MIDWHDLESTNLKRIAWLAESEFLLVEFKSGAIYGYENFPQTHWDQFIEHKPSYGEWFHANILVKWGYVGVKLQDAVVMRRGQNVRKMLEASIDALRAAGKLTEHDG